LDYDKLLGEVKSEAAIETALDDPIKLAIFSVAKPAIKEA
jgi:hypothetical protein